MISYLVKEFQEAAGSDYEFCIESALVQAPLAVIAGLSGFVASNAFLDANTPLSVFTGTVAGVASFAAGTGTAFLKGPSFPYPVLKDYVVPSAIALLVSTGISIGLIKMGAGLSDNPEPIAASQSAPELIYGPSP